MLNLYHLKYFHDAVVAGSVGEAARINRVSQSAVSQSIRALERSLDVELLAHSKRRFEVTSDGRRVFRDAAAVFESTERILRKQDLKDMSISGPLKIGISHSLGKSILANHLKDLQRQFSNFGTVVRIGNAGTLEQLLETRQIEVGIGLDANRFAKFERRIIRKGRFCTVVRKNLKPYPNTYIVGDKGDEVVLLRGYLTRSKSESSFVEVQSWELIADYTELGMGIGLIPDFMLEERPDLKVAKLPVQLPTYQVCAFVRPSALLSKGALTLIDSLEQKSK